MADTPTLELRIQDNSEKAIQGLRSLASSLSDLKRTLTGGLGIDKTLEDLEKLNQKFTATFDTQTVDNINKVADALERLQKASDVKLPDMKANKSSGAVLFMSAIDTPIEYAKPDISAFDSANEDIERKLQDLKDRIEIDNSYPSIEEQTNKLDALNSEIGVLGSETGSANEEVVHLDKTLKDVKENADGASNGFGNLGKGINRVISPLGKIIKAFNRILFYRVIRSVIKEISKGFSEGIANVREYSKAINGSFNTAMTNAENALFKMKNSVGAALAPALEALVPVLQTLVSWFITLTNYVNQFISLLTGKTEWTRAIDASASSFEKTKKSASGAAKEVKNLLADFDELNIIQSQSGGGGGGAGGAVTPDYTKAFEQVTEFDGKIREIVNWTKENLDLIKDTAIAIGAAILGWRVSSAFGGLISQLGSLVAMGATIKLVWDFVTYFDNQFIRTGDIGWLVGDVLTTAAGAYIGSKLMEKVIGEGGGTVGISIVLAVSALASIVASIQNADVSALSRENIINTILASMKMGGAGIALAKFFKLNTADALKIGGGAALITFGAAVAIKAIAQAAVSDDFSWENLKALAIGSITMGGGVTLLGNTLGLPMLKSVGLGAGVAVLTAGVYVGVKAVKQAVDAGFTAETLKSTALASAGIGLGAGLIALSAGAGLGVAGIIAGGAVLATVGAIIGISAILRAQKNDIKWGDISLTEAQIQDYVTQNMFTVNVPAQVNLINSRIANATQAQEDLLTDATKVFSTMNILRLGINQQETLDTLLNQVLGESRDGNGGLMKSLRDDIKQKKELLTFSLSIMPVIDENGNDISKELATNNITGWGKVEEYVTNLGNKLNDLLIDPKTQKLKENLSEYEKNAVSEIVGTMLRISQAVSGANVETTALSNFSISLSDMTEGSARETMKKYGEYRKELEEAYTRLEYETAAGILTRARAAEAIGDTEEAKKAMDEYAEFVKGIPSRVKEQVEKSSEQGVNMVRESLKKVFGDSLEGYQWGDKFNSFMEKQLLGSNASDDELAKTIVKRVKDNILTKIGASEEMFSDVGLEIFSMIGDSAKNTMVERVANMFGLDVAELFAEAIGVNVPDEVRDAVQKALLKAQAEAAIDAYTESGKKRTADVNAARERQEQLERETAQLQKEQEEAARARHILEVSDAMNEVAMAENAIAQKRAEIERIQREIEKNEQKYNNPTAWDLLSGQNKSAQMALYYGSNSFAPTGGLYVELEQAKKELEEATAKAAELQKQLDNLTLGDDLLGDDGEEITDIEFVVDDSALEPPVTAPDLSGVTGAFDAAQAQVHGDVEDILRDAERLGNIQFQYSFGGGGGMKMVMKAGGGFVGTGDLFMAREAGPELVGRIGSRTAVANNDQIVQGVAGGVAAGQSEQNSLLRQQNDLLMQILQKSGKAEAVPSADWGRFIKRSSEMYANNTGT